jgi:hypothetical protein
MKNTERNAVEIFRKGGVVLASEWTTGTGNYINKRPIPAGCEEVSAKDAAAMKGETGKSARRLLKAHPRAKKMVVVADRRTVSNWAKEAKSEV